MKFVSPDTRCNDYKKRRSAFLMELIALTPNVSLRAQEFRRWTTKTHLIPTMTKRRPGRISRARLTRTGRPASR
jgi:hypothetical protein